MAEKSLKLEPLVPEQKGCWVIGFTGADIAGRVPAGTLAVLERVSGLLPQSPSQQSLGRGGFHTLSPSETLPCTKMEPVQ